MIKVIMDSNAPMKKKPIENMLINAQIITIFKRILLKEKIDPNNAGIDNITIINEKMIFMLHNPLF